ncbi:MAG: transcriptional regulator [Candidatus Dadabacteria bacterium]
MPIYEFICENCGPFEIRREMKDASKPIVCSNCKVIAERIFSLPGLITTQNTLRPCIEQSIEPKIIRRFPSGKPTSKRKHPHRGSGRPWMIGH